MIFAMIVRHIYADFESHSQPLIPIQTVHQFRFNSSTNSHQNKTAYILTQFNQ